jgi:hypothetical protein
LFWQTPCLIDDMVSDHISDGLYELKDYYIEGLLQLS